MPDLNAMQHTFGSTLASPPSVLPPPEHIWFNRPVYRPVQTDDRIIEIFIDGTGLSLESFVDVRPFPWEPVQWHVVVRFYGGPVGGNIRICLQQTKYIFFGGKPDILFVVQNQINLRGPLEISYYRVEESEYLHPRYSLLRVTSCGEPVAPDGMVISEASSTEDSDDGFDMVEVDIDFQTLRLDDTPAGNDDDALDDGASYWDSRHQHLGARLLHPVFTDE